MVGETEVLGESRTSVTLSTTNPTWPDLGKKSSRQGENPTTNHPDYGTVFLTKKKETPEHDIFAHPPIHIVAYRPVARQRPRNKQREKCYRRCYPIGRYTTVLCNTFLGIGSVNTSPRQRIRTQQQLLLETVFSTWSVQSGYMEDNLGWPG
jgi:hypothetical protein